MTISLEHQREVRRSFRSMRFAVIIFFLFTFATVVFPQQQENPDVTRIEANPAKGFSYAYYLYLPESFKSAENKEKLRTLLVIPNNSGKINDDIAFHDADVKRKISGIGPFMTTGGVSTPLLMPVFPRPATEHRLYTHSLDRDTFITDKKEFHRLDLQLAAMIKDAQARLKGMGVRTEEKVLMQGYSASGMFVNRFVFLHPKLVKAAIIGAPGGWPTAPVSEFGGKKLTFPAGISDLKDVAGKKFDLKAVRQVPMFHLLGGVDTNDAVPMGDAYDKRESELVIELFGKTPVERFPHAQKLYKEAGLNAEFKMYPDTPHQMSAEMRTDQVAFLKKYAL